MSFRSVPFDDVFADESGGNIKTPQSEYKSVGKFPVVDQGKNLIAGYVDEASRICGDGRPAIVFGDHTRCVKYVDFPFCMGADGVKVLRPKIDADLKYLYHYLTTVKLTNAGYDRHYKYLKRVEVVLTPLPEQRRIAAILDQADALRAKRREALAQLDSLTQSIFIEMFGDVAANAAWPTVELQDVADLLTGFAFKSDEYVSESNGSVKLCRGANVMPNRVDWSDLACWPISNVGALSDFQLQTDDIVMAMDRPWISEGFKLAKISSDDCPALLVQRVSRIRGKNNVANTYLYELLKQPAFARHCRPTETTIPHISPKEIRSFAFRLPPEQLRRKFVERIGALHQIRAKSTLSISQFDSLFASLQHRAFQGEL